MPKMSILLIYYHPEILNVIINIFVCVFIIQRSQLLLWSQKNSYQDVFFFFTTQIILNIYVFFSRV
jgi:hypothetical protein